MHDVEQIKKLRAADAAAAKELNYEFLRSIISDSAEIFAPGVPVISGKENIDRVFSKKAAFEKKENILKYEFHFGEPIITGDFAIESGLLVGETKMIATGEIKSYTCKVVRVLRKEEGEWKIFLSIWNE